MGHRKAPYLKPPSRPIIQTLPPELLHNIFSHLEETDDVCSARRTCTLLAVIGLDYFGDEVPLVFHRDKFRALVEIANHAKLAPKMRSLFFKVGRFKNLTYDRWNEERLDPLKLGRGDYLMSPKTIGFDGDSNESERSWRHMDRATTKALDDNQARIAAVPESKRQEGFAAF